MMFFLTVAFIILLILILISNGITIENGRKRAGNRGEAIIFNQLKWLINDRDRVLTNVEVIYDHKKSELDCVIINENGVFIIEVKNFRGQLYGREEDNLWQKCKVSR
ncbi:NERD domain-containing protein [[Clostridium] spiroforme]|nr:NERD domain-containing protein [Thomasclavelia spiroformis]